MNNIKKYTPFVLFIITGSICLANVFISLHSDDSGYAVKSLIAAALLFFAAFATYKSDTSKKKNTT